jgi:phospholipid/cholesterol/gamma-HCH transport system ATP-binding protein
MIRIENIHKKFDEQPVLEGISGQFDPGKTNLIIGRSGSGKTVLLKSVVGLHEVDKGSITYDGQEFVTASARARRKIRRQIGMVFQGGALFTSESVENNVRFPLEMFSDLSKSEKQKRVDECLERVGVVGVNNAFPSEISGGMQKRVAIARAIVLNPRFLFCDEPNSGLDPRTAIRIDNLIHELTLDYNMTTIINTHDMNSVMQIGDHIIFLHEGKKEWEGDKTEIFDTGNKEFNDFVFASEMTKKLVNS